MGLCGRHYREDLQARKGPCTVNGCDRLQQARGWCQGHYERWREYRDVYPHIPLGAATLHPRPCGTPAAYNRGCRCDDCRQANADRKRDEYRRVRVTAWPVIRHVERLMADGMTRSDIARAAGLPYSTVATMLHGRRWLHPHTAEAIRAVPLPSSRCTDCGREPMAGGAIRCLLCFQRWVAVRRKSKSAQARKAGLISTRKGAA